jgi:uncharacterized Fe-S cluster-containing radical SAM superfamily enzyme
MQGKPNKNKKGRQAEFYIYIAALDENGCVNKLLLTKKEFESAKKRALNNPEDTFGDVVAFQIINHNPSHEIGHIKPENLI